MNHRARRPDLLKAYFHYWDREDIRPCYTNLIRLLLILNGTIDWSDNMYRNIRLTEYTKRRDQDGKYILTRLREGKKSLGRIVFEYLWGTSDN